MERLKELRLHITFGAVATIIMGLLFLFWADGIATTFARVIGLILLLIGGTQFLGKLFGDVNRSSGMLIGGLIAIIGIWVILNPESAVAIIPMIIGVVLVVHGIQDLSLAFAGRAVKMPRWRGALLVGILDIVMGVVCIVCAFRMVTLALQLIGIMMIYDGVTSGLIVHNVNRAEKDVIDSHIIRETTDDEGNGI